MTVVNPVDGSEDLNRMPEDAWGAFLTSLQALRDAAERASDAIDEVSAALIWSEQFSFLMPLPEIEITVFRGDSSQPYTSFLNEVPSVDKDCSLVFRIKNAHIIPDYATVEWTVRNAGEESDGIGDLGHRQMGMRLLTVREHTTYVGRHFMDCVVRLNGQVYSARRILVNIRNVLRAERNPNIQRFTQSNFYT